MCLRFLGRFKRFAAVGGSDGVLRGFGEWLEEDQRGRFCMLNRRNHTRNGHDWNPMSDMELESLRGGFVFLEGVFAKRGVRTNPPNPPWLRACDIRQGSINRDSLACFLFDNNICDALVSPVNLSPKSPKLDKIATETLFVGNYSHTHPEQHIKNIDDRMQAKVA